MKDTGKEETTIYTLGRKVRDLTSGQMYPFHMPGHKRRLLPDPGLPCSFDITEIYGADDLHDADGILEEAMERTAAVFGADRTWYLVGGSTAGNLAAIRAVAPCGSEIIAARNSHKSVYHAAELGNLDVHWVYPQIDAAFAIPGSICPEEVSKALLKYPNTRAVVITSPTYEGVLSDIRSIAECCHKKGIPLVVDEAHGAHLGLFKEGGFPKGALSEGADLVVQSAHKTLPSLTQTALLHLSGNLVDPGEVERQLDIFETSSPSYPLMISLDGCTGILKERGPHLFKAWGDRLDAFGRHMEGVKSLKILCYGSDRVEDHPSFYAFDKSKILIRTVAHKKTGKDLADSLRSRYAIETEMHCGRNALCMTSCADDDAGFARLEKALLSIDEAVEAVDWEKPDEKSLLWKPQEAERSVLKIGEAVNAKRTALPLDLSLGRAAGEYVFPYPPGIPVLVPGEKITREKICAIRALEKTGSTIIHSVEKRPGMVSVLGVT